MDLQVEIKQDFDGTIIVKDFTKNLKFSSYENNGYLKEETEEVDYSDFSNYIRFKYSDTISITVLAYLHSTGEEIVNIIFTNHEILPSESEKKDLIQVPIEKDGYYVVYHFVIPTISWLQNHLNDNILNDYNNIYISDGIKIFKYNKNDLSVNNVDAKELVEINSCYTKDYFGTISKKIFDIFSIKNLKQCYINISKELFKYCPGSTCDKLDPLVRFKRDFIWMTLNVIKFYLDDNMFIDAQNLLEETMTCNQFCRESNPSNIKNSSCGCYR